MTDDALPWSLFGERKIRPFALALCLSVAVLGYSLLQEQTIGQVLDGLPGKFVGVLCVLSFVSFVVGFWGRSERLLTTGLLVASGTWASVTTVLFLDVGATTSTLLAGCWTVAAGGSWLLEKSASR